jgi:hypothetical protein
MIEPRCQSTHGAAGALAKKVFGMHGILHRIVMGVLLVATLVLFWYLLGR